MEPASKTVLESEGIVKQGFVFWYKRKVSAHPGTLYLTSDRVAYLKKSPVVGGLLGRLFGFGKFAKDVPITQISGGSRGSFGKAKQIILDFGEDERFTFAPEKKHYDAWIVALEERGIKISD
jgi:hypothetical protein